MASDDDSNDNDDGPAPAASARRSWRLRASFESGGVAITVWAPAATGRANQERMCMDQARLKPAWDQFDSAIAAGVDALRENST